MYLLGQRRYANSNKARIHVSDINCRAPLGGGNYYMGLMADVVQ